MDQVGLFPQTIPANRDQSVSLAIASLERRVDQIVRTAGLIPAGALGQTYRDAIMSVGTLTNYWRLNETSGTVATDLKGGVAGTYVAPYTQGVASPLGDGGTAVSLTGGRITTTLAPFTAGSKITVSGWAYRNTNTTGDTLFGGTGALPPLLRCSSASNDIRFYANSSAGSATWAAAAPLGSWFHWALTYDDTTRAATLYVNGINLGTLTTPNSFATPGNFEIGTWGTVNDPFDGSVDDVAVFSAVLTAGQIAAHAAAGPRTYTQIGVGGISGGSSGNIAPESVTTAEILAGTIVASDIAVGAITANLMSVSQLSAISANMGTITAGTITGATFQTSASNPRVYMDSTGVGGTDSGGNVLFKLDASTGKVITLAGIGGGNEVRNSSFEDTTLPGQTLTNATAASSTAQFKHGARALLVTSVAAGLAQYNDSALAARRFPVTPGERITLSAWVYAADAQRNVDLRLPSYTSAGVFVNSQVITAQSVPVGVWTRVSGTVTVPATAAAATWGVAFDAAASGQRWYVDAVQAERGELLTAYAPKPDENLPGTITGSSGGGTGEILAGTINGASDIALGTVTANRLNVTQLSAITADMGAVTAGTITGATIRTASSGARVELSGTSLKSYDASNNVVFDIAAEQPAPTMWTGIGNGYTQAAQPAGTFVTWTGTSQTVFVPAGKTVMVLGGGVAQAPSSSSVAVSFRAFVGLIPGPTQAWTISSASGYASPVGTAAWQNSGSSGNITIGLQWGNVASSVDIIASRGWMIALVF